MIDKYEPFVDQQLVSMLVYSIRLWNKRPNVRVWIVVDNDFHKS